MNPPRPRNWLCLDIPLMDYGEARELQLTFVAAKGRGDGFPDVVLLLEHPAVFTLGRRGGRESLLVEEASLKQDGISVFRAERGGDITFHGPGQLVGYPIVDLRANGWKVVDFVGALEEVMIRTASEWGIRAERSSLNRGVWVGMEKLGSVGIAVRRGVSFHGFALNANTHLEAFGWIHPCGLRGIRMTSMERVLGQRVVMEEVRRAVRRSMERVFDAKLGAASLESLREMLGESLGQGHWPGHSRAGGNPGVSAEDGCGFLLPQE